MPLVQSGAKREATIQTSRNYTRFVQNALTFTVNLATEILQNFYQFQKRPVYISARYGRTVVVMKLIFFALVALTYPLSHDEFIWRGVFVDFSKSAPTI